VQQFLHKKLYPAVGLYFAYCLYIFIAEGVGPGKDFYNGVGFVAGTGMFFVSPAMATLFFWLAITGKFPIGTDDPVIFGDKSVENRPQKRRGYIFRLGLFLLAILSVFYFYSQFIDPNTLFNEKVRYMIIPGLIGIFAGISAVSIARKQWDDVRENTFDIKK
jgi:hypothetical protein